MISFILLKDWYANIPFSNDKKKIFNKGHIFEPNEDGEYIIEYGDKSMTSSLEWFDENDSFEEVKHYDIKVEEIESEDDDVKNWRIQLDVKTTQKKLKEFERIFRNEIDKIL